MFPGNIVCLLIAFDQINMLLRYVYDMSKGEVKYTKFDNRIH